MAPPARRTRRSSEEVRARLLTAARECFAEGGYAGTTTKEIARRSGVAEALIFRAFGSKEQLFEQAVLEPFDAFLAAYVDRWMDRPAPGGAPEEVLRQFVEELYAIVREHRELFRAIGPGDLMRSGARPAFDRLERMGEVIAARTGVPFDAHVAVRVAAATVVSTALFEEALFDPTVTRPRIVDEVVRMLVGATLHAPAAE
jgi:AcrR family transcriptional regulator